MDTCCPARVCHHLHIYEYMATGSSSAVDGLSVNWCAAYGLSGCARGATRLQSQIALLLHIHTHTHIHTIHFINTRLRGWSCPHAPRVHKRTYIRGPRLNKCFVALRQTPRGRSGASGSATYTHTCVGDGRAATDIMI